MGANRWDEAGRIWEEDHTLLEKSQLDKCARAYEADSLQSPVPMEPGNTRYGWVRTRT